MFIEPDIASLNFRISNVGSELVYDSYCQVLGMVLMNCVCALIPKCISQDLGKVLGKFYLFVLKNHFI